MVMSIYLQMLNLPGSLVGETESNPPKAYFGGDRGLPVPSSRRTTQLCGTNSSEEHSLEGKRSSRPPYLAELGRGCGPSEVRTNPTGHRDYAGTNAWILWHLSTCIYESQLTYREVSQSGFQQPQPVGIYLYWRVGVPLCRAGLAGWHLRTSWLWVIHMLTIT